MSSICRDCGKKMDADRDGLAQICSKCRAFMEKYHKRLGIRIIEDEEVVSKKED